jgi:transposase-like protein
VKSHSEPVLPPRGETHRALLEAIDRVCRTDGVPTIAAVAREVGVSASLIHNRYPRVADTIRTLAGKQKRDEVAALRAALETEKARSQELRVQNAQMLADLRALASINESLRREIAIERAKSAGKVITLRRPADRE